ncbi:AmmeMemoRadiSam system radical SAM enzyme [Sporohalobacter salinus]|uniref:AmmeMemoRadiSam system radical SAM enzyme n=1 Tax=Sporohalobacter salinus TaxID=1494606 RepID=UPI001960512F|nr:AmmeMemoRadiSam system radical SAM enzyme [Sporohalobacter salinus]MBM7624019.1 pyruvate formate lyase activating enzyme [Sporohalobacter salinus]
MKEAHWYERINDKEVRCNLCPHNCLLAVNQTGVCQARENQEGKLVSKIYGQVSALAVDPIEKKPLFHFYPGSEVLSLGTVGCNLSCQFCQNYHIAHDHNTQTRKLEPKEVVELTKEHNSIGIAYTYSEPLIWYEYILNTAQLIHQAGLKNVLVTNGLINPRPLAELLPYIDGLNIDLKAFSEDFYNDICQGYLEPVKESISLADQESLVEVTTLLIPGLNDSREEIERLVTWLAGINPDIPLHFTRYFPKYKLDAEQTPVETLLQAKEIAEEKLNFVYLGNVRQPEYSNTYCYECGQLLIKRDLSPPKVYLQENVCPECGTEINILMAD